MVELTALSSRSGRAIVTFLNCYVSHGEAFKKQRKNIFIVQITNCCLQQRKNFQNRLTFDDDVAKSSTPRF